MLIVTGAATTVVAVVAIRSKPWRSSEEAAPAVEAEAIVTDESETEESETEESETETTPSTTVEASTESVQ